jgi:hypothetical protein
MANTASRVAILCASAGCSLILPNVTCDAGGYRKAVCTRTVPDYNYQSAVTPLRATVASYPAVPGSIPDDPSITTKLFRPLTNELMVGECTLTNLRLEVYSNGEYNLSFNVTNAASTAEPAQRVDVQKPVAKAPNDGIQRLPVRHHRVQVTARLVNGAAIVPAQNTAHAAGVIVASVTEGPVLVVAGEVAAQQFHNTALTPIQYREAVLAEFELEVDPEFPKLPPSKQLPAKRCDGPCKLFSHH